MKAYYFDGDSVGLTDEQRELLDGYWHSQLTALDFINMCRQVLSLATGRDNKASIAQAIVAIYKGEDAEPGAGDKHLKLGITLSEIEDEASILADADEEKLGDKEFDRHWVKLSRIVEGQA